MNKQWMALLLSTGIAVTACPVPAAQMPPAEQIHGEAEETSVPVQHDDSDDRETANEFQSEKHRNFWKGKAPAAIYSRNSL